MISTGINGVDEMLGGGIPRGSRALYSMEPGVDGQLFMISALARACEQGLSCLVILPHTTVDAFLHDVAAMREEELNLSSKTVVFFDTIDRERIQRTVKKPEARSRQWQIRVQKICREKKIDVIFAYFDLMYDDFGLENGLKILESAREDNTSTLIIEHLNLEGRPLVTRFTDEFAFDLVISLSSSFRPLPHFNYFTLVHAGWSPVPVRSVPFIIAQGRIIPYIPKIVVTGPANSGKSTFVSNASDEGHSVDRTGLSGDTTTVAMDFGWLRWKDFDITLYGTPGQTRFDPLIPPILKHAMGVVLVIDATKPDTLPRAKHLIELVMTQRVPLVVAANKNDLPQVIGTDEIRAALGIADDIPVFPISATKRTDVSYVLESLVDFITQFSY
jgi:small GTP-binding protein